MLVRHPWRIVVVVLVAAVIIVAAYVAYLAYEIDKDLGAVQADAKEFRSAVVQGDQTQITLSLTRLQSDSETASSHTGSPFWSLAGHLPVFGDDARGVRTAADVVDTLSHHGLSDLAASTTQLNAVVPKDGRINVKAIARLQAPVSEGARALDSAENQLAAQDPSGYVGKLKEKYRYLQSEVSSASDILNSANTAVEVLPAMLGEHGPKNYLLIVQNNAEIRASGGLPGAVSLVRADHGKLTMVKQVPGSHFGDSGDPVLPLTKVERQLYGDQLATYFLDANFTPDFARSSDLWKARWQQDQGGKVDGVLSLDPVTLSYILKATGPVKAGDLTLNSDNAVKTLLSEVYAKFPDPAMQDEVFRGVAGAVFDKVAKSAGNPQELIAALSRGAKEHRVYVHSFDPAVQEQLNGSAVSGTFVTDATKNPQVNVTVNDTTGAKMSYYLRYDLGVTANYCTKGVQGLTGSMELRSVAPKNAGSTLPDVVTGGGKYGIEPGDQLDTVRVYGPVGGKIGKVTMNGKPVNAYTFDQGDRPVAMFYVQLTPGQTVDYAWTMTSGAHQTGDTQVRATPSVASDSPADSVGSAC